MNKADVYLLNLNGDGYGDGSGYGDGYGDGSGYGYGSGSGDGSGDGSGSGDGYGDGSGYGYGSGDGDGSGVYLAKLYGRWFEISGQIENSLCHNLPEDLYSRVVTKDFIKAVNNLESLRIIRDKIGLSKYLSLFDVKLIDEDTDDQGKQMKLYQYDEQGEKVQILECVCPSTDRMYHLYPPNQKSKNVWDAKSSTFNKKRNQFKPETET